MPSRSICLAGVSIIACLALYTSAARAQRLVQASATAPRSNDHVTLGVGLAHLPVYQGADTYRTLPLPIFDVAKGRLFANLRNGAGVNVVDEGGITIGASLTPVSGYRTRDVPQGVERLKFGAGGRLFLNADLGLATATIGATRAVFGGTGGVVVDASFAHPILLSPKLILIPSLGATWADRRHNSRYFGIDGREALASGLSGFSPNAGLKDLSAGLVANYRLTGSINLSASANVSTLMSEVKDSPLVRRRTQPSMFVSTTFSL